MELTIHWARSAVIKLCHIQRGGRAMKPEPGWLDRKIEMIEEESRSWPTWMKRAAGLVDAPGSDAKGLQSEQVPKPEVRVRGKPGESA
jgi:hypothetical protein